VETTSNAAAVLHLRLPAYTAAPRMLRNGTERQTRRRACQDDGRVLPSLPRLMTAPPFCHAATPRLHSACRGSGGRSLLLPACQRRAANAWLRAGTARCAVLRAALLPRKPRCLPAHAGMRCNMRSRRLLLAARPRLQHLRCIERAVGRTAGGWAAKRPFTATCGFRAF